nr:phosphoglycerate dehydrogenase [Algoriphagus sp.]
MKPVILLLETVAEEAMKILLDTKEFETVLALDEKSLQEAIGNGNVSAIITRGKGQVRAELMDQLPQLQIIARCGVGLDNIDV